MGRFRATPEDLARGRIVRPGWHPVEITDVKDTTDKTNAALTVVHARTLTKGEDEGAMLRTNFSEKAPGFVKNFVEAKGVKFEANKDYEINNQNFRGTRMEWYVERDTYKGRPTNNVVDYRPLQS